MMHPYVYPQHPKKLFAYIQHGYGMQSMRVCSLNHDTATSYRYRALIVAFELSTQLVALMS
jgi:hypothetical protein